MAVSHLEVLCVMKSISPGRITFHISTVGTHGCLIIFKFYIHLQHTYNINMKHKSAIAYSDFYIIFHLNTVSKFKKFGNPKKS